MTIGALGLDVEFWQAPSAGGCANKAAFVQSLGSVEGTIPGKTLTITYVLHIGHTTTPGNWVAVAILWFSNSTASTLTVSDSRGNAYVLTHMPGAAGHGYVLGLLWTTNATHLRAGDTITLKVKSLTATRGPFTAQALEYSGLMSFQTANFGRYKTFTTGFITPPTNCEMFIALCYNSWVGATHNGHANPQTPLALHGAAGRAIYHITGNINYTSVLVADYQNPTLLRVKPVWSPLWTSATGGANQLSLYAFKTH